MPKGRKVSVQLDELISSLEPKEKRYISIFLRQYKENNNVYFDLFNLVSKTNKSGKKKHPLYKSNVIKVQLYWKILKALQLYHSETDPTIRKNNLLSQFHVLVSKGLDRHALRVLKNAKEVCKSNDFTDDLFFINKQETKLLLEENEGSRNEGLISAFNRANLQQLKVIKQNYSLTKVYLQNKLNLNFFKPSLNETAYRISNSFSLSLNETSLLSDRGAILNYLNLGLYFTGIKEYKTALKHLNSSYQIYLKNINLILSYKEDYCELIELISQVYLFNNKTSELYKWIKECGHFLEEHHLYDTEKKILLNTALTEIFRIEEETIRAEHHLKILNQLKHLNKNLKYNFLIDFQNIKQLCENKHFGQVFKSFSSLFNVYPVNYRPSYQVAAKVFYLILLFIQKDYLLLSSEIKKTKYYI